MGDARRILSRSREKATATALPDRPHGLTRVGDGVRGEQSVVWPQTESGRIAQTLPTAGLVGNHHGVYSASRFSCSSD
jgi:hypothetical protein